MNIALLGHGKTGKEIEKILLERNHTIVEIFTSKNLLTDKKLESLKNNHTDCCIDFSTPETVYQNIERIISHNIPIIVGTTGWNSQIEEIKKIVQLHNGAMVYGSNFSIGANIFFKLASYTAQLLNNFSEYDIALHEIHHILKKDSPSGTALTIANAILEKLQRKNSLQYSTEKPIQKNELLVTSSRIGSVIGTHTIHCNSVADDIELTHRAHNRNGFALGAVLAAEWIQNKKGIFTVEEFLFSDFI